MHHNSNPSDVNAVIGRTLADLPSGQRARILKIDGDASFKSQLAALGIVRGMEIAVERAAPLGDPRAYTLLGYLLTIRNADARQVYLESEA